MANKTQIGSTGQTFGDKAFNFAVKLFGRVFTRLFIIPIYGALIAPWIILLVENTSEAVQKKFHGFVAILAGNPGAETLDEGDLAVAVITIFLAIELIGLIISKLRGHKLDKAQKDRAAKRKLIIEIALTVTGWTVLAINQYSELGVQGMIILPGLGIAVSSFFFLEYGLRNFFDYIENNLLK